MLLSRSLRALCIETIETQYLPLLLELRTIWLGISAQDVITCNLWTCCVRTWGERGGSGFTGQGLLSVSGVCGASSAMEPMLTICSSLALITRSQPSDGWYDRCTGTQARGSDRNLIKRDLPTVFLRAPRRVHEVTGCSCFANEALVAVLEPGSRV